MHERELKLIQSFVRSERDHWKNVDVEEDGIKIGKGSRRSRLPQF
jgi:hypothetical protein